MATKFSISTKFMAVDKLSPVFKKMTNSSEKFGVKMNAVAAVASSKFKKFWRSLRSLKVFLIGFFAALGIQRFVKMLDSVGKLGDRIAKTARAVDITTGGLQKLRFAAERQGASIQSLDKGLQKLNRNVGELRVGSGTLRTMLMRVDPAFIKVMHDAKGTEDAFVKMVKRIDEAPDTFEKTALAVAGFGREGVELLNLTKGGFGNILDLMNRFERLGGVASEEVLKLSEAYMDATLDMKIATRGLKFAIAEKLLPSLTRAINKFAVWIADNKKFIALGIEKVVDKIKGSFDNLKKAFDKIKPQDIQEWVSKLDTVLSAAEAIGRAFLGIAKAMQEINRLQDKMNVGIFSGQGVLQVGATQASGLANAIPARQRLAAAGAVNSPISLAGVSGIGKAVLDIFIKTDKGTTADVKQKSVNTGANNLIINQKGVIVQ